MLISVCAAVEPFHLDELQHYVSLLEDPDSLISYPERQPSRDTVIECGANLIVVDHADDLVLPIHHSVIQHVIPGQEREDAERDIGRQCLLYLGSMGTIQNAKLAQRPVARIPVLPGLPSFLHKLLGDRSVVSGTLAIDFTTRRPVQSPVPGQRTFLNCAQRAWLQSNRSIHSRCKDWDHFCSMAISPSNGAECPWPVQASSWTSHISGLFTWAVTQSHLPLLEVALKEEKSRRARAAKLNLLELPLTVEKLGSALHLAASIGHKPVFDAICHTEFIMNQDLAGNTPLHIAAFKGHYAIVKTIMDQWLAIEPKLRKPFTSNARSESILHSAVVGKNIDCIRYIVDRYPDAGRAAESPNADGLFPLQIAARCGDAAFFNSAARYLPSGGLKYREILSLCTQDIVRRGGLSMFGTDLTQYNASDGYVCLKYSFSNADETTAMVFATDFWESRRSAVLSACVYVRNEKLRLSKLVFSWLPTYPEYLWPNAIDEGLLLSFACGEYEYFCDLVLRKQEYLLNAIRSRDSDLRYASWAIKREMNSTDTAIAASIFLNEERTLRTCLDDIGKHALLMLLNCICNLHIPELDLLYHNWQDHFSVPCMSAALHAIVAMTQQLPKGFTTWYKGQIQNINRTVRKNDFYTMMYDFASDFEGDFTSEQTGRNTSVHSVYIWLAATQDHDSTLTDALEFDNFALDRSG